MAAGQPFGQIESVKATSDVYSFVTGKVVEVNEALADDPGMINSDAFDKGWLVKVKATDLSGLASCMDAAAYEAMLNQA